MDKIRVLIADDSALMRREIKKILESDPGIEVIYAARDGKDAVEKTRELEPDVVALDINMPVMDGMTALQYIMMESPRPVVMVSSLTQEGALVSYEALELGAVDFVGKPGGTISLDLNIVARDIIRKIKSAALSSVENVTKRRSRKTRASSIRRHTGQKKAAGDRIVVIGQSTGGPNTIQDVLPFLHGDMGASVVVIQHMPATFTPMFAQRLDSMCDMPFKHADRGDIIKSNHGYLAPGDTHLYLAKRGLGKEGCIVRLSAQPEDSLFKPSVNVTMRSILSVYEPENIIAVLLTGMGDDGADAMVDIRNAGGHTIAESEETAVVFGMPKEAIARGGAEYVLPSHKVGEKILDLLSS